MVFISCFYQPEKIVIIFGLNKIAILKFYLTFTK